MRQERGAQAGRDPSGSPLAGLADRPARTHRLRVVIVDDEPGVAAGLAEFLSAHFEVRAFTDPGRALEFIRANKVELLVTDWHMPTLDGVRLATEAKRLRPGLKILMVTGTPGASALGESHVDLMLTKPVRPRQLTSWCQELLGKELGGACPR